MFLMTHSPQPTVAVDTNDCGSIKAKAGGRYTADLVLQLPARGPVPLLFALRSLGSTGHLDDAIAREYEVTVLRYGLASDSV
ncbi:hypothetical protein [Bradyrhizobium sp. UFLA05-112]